MHLLGHLFHLSGAVFISHGSKFKPSHNLGSDYNSQYLSSFLPHHWISVVLHGPSFHPTTIFDLGEQISFLTKKNVPLEISV